MARVSTPKNVDPRFGCVMWCWTKRYKTDVIFSTTKLNARGNRMMNSCLARQTTLDKSLYISEKICALAKLNWLRPSGLNLPRNNLVCMRSACLKMMKRQKASFVWIQVSDSNVMLKTQMAWICHRRKMSMGVSDANLMLNKNGAIFATSKLNARGNRMMNSRLARKTTRGATLQNAAKTLTPNKQNLCNKTRSEWAKKWTISNMG